MKRIYLVLIMSMILFTNCKNSSKEQLATNEIEKVEELPDRLEIKFSFKTNKTDVFKIIMNNIQVDELQKKNIQILETVSPSTQFESINAKFDEGNMSKNIAFHLGNKEVKEVAIDKINITYKNKVIDVSTAEDFSKYFRLSKYMELDSTSRTLKTKKVEGKHYPVFYFSKKLINTLSKE